MRENHCENLFVVLNKTVYKRKEKFIEGYLPNKHYKYFFCYQLYKNPIIIVINL